MQDCKVNILGTEYSIYFVKEYPKHMKEFEESADGLCNSYNREIYIKDEKQNEMTIDGQQQLLKKNLRHEIYHAFLFESGLSSNTLGSYGAWAEHEEMVDWFAIQSPKIFKVFQELDII